MWPFAEGIRAGVGSVMMAYNAVRCPDALNYIVPEGPSFPRNKTGSASESFRAREGRLSLLSGLTVSRRSMVRLAARTRSSSTASSRMSSACKASS